MANLVLGYVLVVAVGDFVGGLNLDSLVVDPGALMAATGPAWHFWRVREG